LAASIALKAAIRRFRSSLPGIRQIRDRIHRHAFHQLGADRPVAENARGGADDLAPKHELSTLKQKLTSLEWQLVPENLIGMGEQEPNPVRRHGNQDGRKEKTG
jgi:hypothetical protein